MERFPSISESFESDWHLLFVLGYVAWILITGALYAGSVMLLSQRLLFTSSSQLWSWFWEPLCVLLTAFCCPQTCGHMRVCQHCQQQCDIVKSKVVLSKPGWRLESAYPYQQSLFPHSWLKQILCSWQASRLIFTLGSMLKCRHMLRNWIFYR